MPTSRASLLLQLLLVWSLDTYVHCQEASVSRVSTDYVEIAWTRSLQWLGVFEFNVHFTSTSSSDCDVIFPCSSPNCYFSSTMCGLVLPCTETITTITGGNYTAASLVVVAGPEPVTNLNLRLEEGIEYISWVNPSRDSSSCHNETAVRVSFNKEISIIYLEPDKENTSKSLCMTGYGEVAVWTKGGDGQSNSSSGPIIYDGSDVVDLLDFQTCEPVGCSGIEVTWSYVPVCSDVAYFEVTLDYEEAGTANISSTELSLTDLRMDYSYITCVNAVREDGKELDTSCGHCRTAEEVVEDLFAKADTSTSLNISWSPPRCLIQSDIQYQVTITYPTMDSTITQETSLQQTDLRAFTKYGVEVLPIHGDIYTHGTSTTTTAYTLLPTPEVQLDVMKNSIYVSWYLYISSNHDFIIYFKVTWGKQLEHEVVTEDYSYTITDFNSIDEVDRVCVSAFPEDREDFMSDTDCYNITDYDTTRSMIAWWVPFSVLAVLIIAVITTLIYLRYRRGRQQQPEQNNGNETGLVNLGAT